jgi:hypothetical protein
MSSHMSTKYINSIELTFVKEWPLTSVILRVSDIVFWPLEGKYIANTRKQTLMKWLMWMWDEQNSFEGILWFTIISLFC